MHVYIAAPLFNEMERARNLKVKTFVEQLGFQVYLPQENAGISYDLISEENKENIRHLLFRKDVDAVTNCDIIICLLDGRVPDEGSCFELGMAFSLGKICIGYKTDKRAMDINGDNNIMIDGCMQNRVASSLSELAEILHCYK